jgi:hypothetical protein
VDLKVSKAIEAMLTPNGTMIATSNFPAGLLYKNKIKNYVVER